MQIGSRSAVHGADAQNPRHLALLKAGLARKFPSLRDVDVDYSWWGWVDVSHDMMPRVTQPDPAQQVYYAFGYGGNGVSFSACRPPAGAAADGQDGLKWDLPIYDSPLPGHLFAPFRRLGQETCCTVGTTCATRCCEDGAGVRPLNRRPHAVAAHHLGQTGDARIDLLQPDRVKPIRRKLRGALASSMKNTLPGSITTPSASAASASSAASSQADPPASRTRIR